MNESAVSPRADHEVAGEWKAAFSWPGAGRHLPRPPYKVCPKFVINDRKLENPLVNLQESLVPFSYCPSAALSFAAFSL
jgi:hypothetical protein